MRPIVLFFQSTTRKSWRDKLSGVYEYAEHAGWQVQVVEEGSSPADVREALDIWQPIGCIIDRGNATSKTPLKFFRNTPHVFLDPDPHWHISGDVSVTHDSSATARLAAEELLKSPAAAFTYIHSEQRHFWSRERETAFASMIRAANRRYVVWDGEFSRLPLPCGIFCANDRIAQRAILVATRHGFKIPDDLLFVGVDNDELICAHTNPPLTSVLPDFKRAGYLVAEALDMCLQHQNLQNHLIKYGPIAIIHRESSRFRDRRNPLVQRILSIIAEQALNPNLKTDDIAEAAGCSRRLADLRFRNATGHSIREEIQQRRLEKAKELLLDDNRPIATIANICGYASTSFFKRFFKRETGLTMREWRHAIH